MRPAYRCRTASALTAAALLAACTPGAREPGREPGGAPGTGLTGTVTIVVVGDPVTLDPYSRRATALTRALARPVYRSLYRLTPDGRAVTDLVAGLDVRGRRAVVTLVEGPSTARDVVASARRARPPSGFAGLRVRALGTRRVEFRGRVGRWGRRLARGTWVLPGGRATGDGGGPYRVARRTAGLETVLAARRSAPLVPAVVRVRVRSAPDSAAALRLVGDGDADVGWIPSSVNLDERAAAAGLSHAGALGWESIVLDFRASPLSVAGRAWVARATGRGRLGEGFVRDDGRIATAPIPPGGVRPAAVLVTVPAEDELLVLLLRAVQRRLAARGTDAEALSIPAGDPFPPGAVRIARRLGAPGVSDGAWPAVWPLFRVESTLVWRTGISGPKPNPTLDGPLWNLEKWRVGRPV